jgi:GntR family transcriptional regulator, transcriptional repressor for pyruvate dehydrogenase complex
VDRIRRAIHLGTYLPGERLPSERTLASQLAVSRVTIREALRVLEGEGYLRSEPGTSGPLILPQVRGHEDLVRELRARLPELEDILTFRIANERATAGLAAERRIQKDLDGLEESVEEMRASTSLPEFRRADSAFHLLVADVARNGLFRRAVEDARAAMFLPVDALDFDFALANSLRGHARVLKAIAAADGRRADAAMADHIEITRQELHGLLGRRKERR